MIWTKELVQVKQQIGLVPQEFNFNPFETVQQIVVNQAGYYGVPRKKAIARSEKYLKQSNLWEKRDVRARMLSGGNEAPFDDCTGSDARAATLNPR